jgi:hypothetical protein
MPPTTFVRSVAGIETLITVDREGYDAEIRRAHRNPALDVLAEGDHADQFHAMNDCLSLLERLRSLCDGLEQRDAALSLIVPAVRKTLGAYRTFHSARVLQPPSYEMLKHVLSKFIARIIMIVEDLCVTTHALSLDGKNEIRRREAGFMISGAYVRGGVHRENPRFARQAQVVGVTDDKADRNHSARSDASSSDEELAEEAFETEFDPVEGELEEFHVISESPGGISCGG